MGSLRRHPALRLAVSPGGCSPELAALLALQRAEEPETAVLLSETPHNAVIDDLDAGRCDLGLTWQSPAGLRRLQSSVLWQDELALAVPTRSPLLAYATIPLQELRCYDLLQWCSSGSPELEQRITTCMPAPKRASSFELMATLVAAGYAVGIAPRSQILHGRSWGIIMRQFAHDSYSIHTHLHYLQNPTPAIERFATRATQLLSRIQKDAYGL